MRHAVFVGDEPQRPVTGARRVPDRLLRAAASGGLEEVVRQFVEVQLRIGGVQLFERLGDAQVEPQPACGCQVIVEAVAHEYVGEGIVRERRRALNDNRCPERLVECHAERASREAGRDPDAAEVELPAGDGRDGEELSAIGRKGGEPAADRLAHPVGDAEVP